MELSILTQVGTSVENGKRVGQFLGISESLYDSAIPLPDMRSIELKT